MIDMTGKNMKFELYIHDLSEGEEELLKTYLQGVCELLAAQVDLSDVAILNYERDAEERPIAYSCIEMVGHDHPIWTLVADPDGDVVVKFGEWSS